MAISKKDLLIKKEFPILESRDVTYLDNAATTQKPPCVMQAVSEYYSSHNANPMRGLYELSMDATDVYEESRQAVCDFIGARSKKEIIFTRNASESLNVAAFSLGRAVLNEGDEVLVSVVEHHSNMLPWRQVCKERGANLIYMYPEKDGTFTPEMLEKAITPKTKIITHTHISNVFGRCYDVKAFADIAHRHGAYFVMDGAQSVPHVPVNMADFEADLMAFSGHKMFAPMGIGVLYGKEDVLNLMPPFLLGGEMIEYVTLEGATFAELPHKFEAGTVNVGGAVGLKEAINFMNRFGFEEIMRREDSLTEYAFSKMESIEGIEIIGSMNPDEHHGIITFRVEGVHPHDVAEIFNSEHIAVRAGHHCAQPLHKYLGSLSTTRASLAFYNNTDDIDRFISCLSGIRKRMGY